MSRQEFVAHADTINTVSIGRKSSAVLASGSDDNTVKIWKLGKTTPLLDFAHNTQVDSVLFDVEERCVLGGSRGGTCKMWDLSAGKLVRTYAGHRASVTCLDFHPFGHFFATGCQDTHVRIFDSRATAEKASKQMMQAYKGHTMPVTCIRHSPDGRWIVSGDAAGVAKIWDISAGRLLHEIKLPAKEKITGLDFHPNEFLLAISGEHSGAVFWDMERTPFTQVCATPKEPHPLRTVRFSACGRGLFVPSGDQLKVWSWDPSQMLDVVEVGWGAGSSSGTTHSAGGGASLFSGQVLADIAEGPFHELIGVTRKSTILSVFLVDLAQVKPFDQPHLDDDGQVVATPPLQQQLQRDQGGKPLMETMQRITLNEPPLHSFVPSAAAAAAAASPVSSPTTHQKANKSFFDAHAALVTGAPNGVHVVMPSKPNPFTKPTAADLLASAPPASHQQPRQPFVPTPAPAPAVPLPASTSFVPTSTSTIASQDQVRHEAVAVAVAAAAAATPTAPLSPPRAAAPAAASRPTTAAPPAATTAAAAAATAAAPTPASVPTAAAPAPAPGADAESRRATIFEQHDTMLGILRPRLVALKKLQAHWVGGSPRRCLDELLKLNDLAVAVDFLTFAEPAFASSRPPILTLEMARDLLPLCKQLLGKKFEAYALCALRYIKLLLLHFTDTIRKLRDSVAPSGVDLAREERVARANDCFDQFKTIYDTALAPIVHRKGAVGDLARETQTLLEALIWGKSS